MKTVFTNDMVAHVWAQRSQADGRSSNGQFYFNGDTIFSYRDSWPLATFYGDAIFINTQSYSVTTSKHLGYVWRALNYERNNAITVDAELMRAIIDAKYYKALKPHVAKRMKELTELSIGAELDAAAKRKKKALAQSDLNAAVGHIDTLEKIFSTFGRKLPVDMRNKRARIQGNAEDIIKLHKNELAKMEVRRKEGEKRAIAQRLEKYEESIAEFRKGEKIQIHTGSDFPAALRISEDGENIETSQGATFPKTFAKKAWQKIKSVASTGIAWERNGETVRLGHFQVDGIYPHHENGFIIKAGCHTVEYAEVERLAKQLNFK